MKQRKIRRIICRILGTAGCAMLFVVTVLFLSKVINSLFLTEELTGGRVTSEGILTEHTPGSGQQLLSEPLPDKVLSDTPVQLVFVPGRERRLSHCFLTILNCREETLSYIEIPVNTRMVTSAELYRKMVLDSTAVPQIIILSEIYNYFQDNCAYQHAVSALQEVIPIPVDYYTVLPEELYNTIYRETVEDYRYAGFLQEKLSETIQEAGGMKAYLSGIWEQCESSLSPADKLYYLESYEGLTNLGIHYNKIPGEQHNHGYEIICGQAFVKSLGVSPVNRNE